jgi:hypothetical protein
LGEEQRMTLREWLNSGKYLPWFLRDFHDQKEVFKRIQENVNRVAKEKKSDPFYEINWTQAHVYVIDFFLWFMACHGYTLQKTRTKVEFSDIVDTMEEFRTRSLKSLGTILNSVCGENNETKTTKS